MTDRQKAALAYLGRPGLHSRTRTGWAGLGAIAGHLGTPRQGATRTLASLVRHGLVERSVSGGATFYRLTKP